MGTMQSPNIIQNVYDKIVFTTSAVDAGTHDIFMTDTTLNQDRQIKRLSISSRQVFSVATTVPFYFQILCFILSEGRAIESSDILGVNLGFFCPKNGRVISSALTIEGAIEAATSWVDFGISVWDSDNLDEHFLHTNVNKGYYRQPLMWPGQDLDNYNEVVFDPDTMDNLDTNEFEQGNSILIWWIFNDVIRSYPNGAEGLTRASVVLEFDA